MGKKRNKVLRDSSGKKNYTDSDEILKLRRELVKTVNTERGNTNSSRNKKIARFNSLNSVKKW